ncbi:basic helix-loop-helix ARNT-like protein 2 [Dendropsophus ebraccatus]|uniref:basic helix-loop-helix ARNT-like protein 2 n=1 Tax=Dendropsophus ebraccatus TaxID=150705 RepID=UPI0038320D48
MSAAGGDGEELPDTLIMEPSQCLAVSSILGPKPGSRSLTSSPFSSRMVDFTRKRKLSESDKSTLDGNDGSDVQSKQAHSETEKRRRDKMNTLIEELSAMIPQCDPLPRKLDKLTVLKMAVQHLKTLKGSSSSFAEESYRPSFLRQEELKRLILKAADGFLFVVGCDRGKILFVSESVSKTLKYTQADLIGQSLFDYLHPKDVAKVKEQLSSPDITPREKLIDAKTGLQVTHFQTAHSRLHWGSRRSFFCRMKMGRPPGSEGSDFLSGPKKKEHRRYCTIHCTGYLRTCLSSEVGVKEDCEADKESYSFSCLVAIGRLHPYIVPQSTAEIKVKPTEFVTRYTMDGKFVYVDQRATAILGYLPQELLGTSCYEYFHPDDHTHLTEQHKAVLKSKEKILTNRYKFKAKDGSFIILQSQWFSFINPWTKEFEYIVSINTVVSSQGSSMETLSLQGSSHSSEDGSKLSFLHVPGMSSGMLLGAANIGREIAKQILELQRLQSPPFNGNRSPNELLKKSPPALELPPCEVQKDELVRLSPSEIEKLDAPSQNDLLPSFSIPDNLLSDSSAFDFENDEATLMNFLEADGGLGEDGDLHDMHWTI